MAILKSVQDIPTKFKHNEIFKEYNQEIEKISVTQYANFIGTTKQNVSAKMKNDSCLLLKEQIQLLEHLEKSGNTNHNLYKKLHLPNRDNYSDIVTLPLKTEVSVSCGNGYNVDDEKVHDKVTFSNNILEYLVASKSKTEVIYAKGDSMLPEINDGDMLFVDKSQSEIKNDCIYAFCYDGEAMCKLLNKNEVGIVAISKNPNYKPFLIDTTLNFRIIGRVVGLIHPVR